MQLSFVDPYPSTQAQYEVLEITGAVLARNAHLGPNDIASFKVVSSGSDFVFITDKAREHCVAKRTEVWVVDRADSSFVALRVTPEEYGQVRAFKGEPALAA